MTLQATSPAPAQTAARTALPILTALSVSHCLNDLLQSLLPAIYPNLKQDLSLSFAEIGLITLVFQVTASLLQPAAEKAAAYSRHVYDIAASTNADIGKLVEAQSADVQAKYMSVVDAAAKNAPAGSENAVALVRTAVAAANNAFETVQKAAKQAANVAESNFQAMAATAEKATAGTAKSRRAA